MKNSLYFKGLYLLTTLFLVFSCSNDDCEVMPQEEKEEENPDNPDGDGQDPMNDPVESADYLALKTFYEANDGNTLGWNLDDKSMNSWQGVGQENERVVRVDAVDKGLKTLVPEMGNLEMLEELNLGQNEFESIPEEIGQLSALQYLRMEENKLNSLPAEIGNLASLIELSLETNTALSTIPMEIGDLAQLSTLNLSGNLMDSIPPEIGNLSQLQLLDLSNNALKKIPREIGNLAALEMLNIADNDLTLIPQEVCNLEEDGTTTITKDVRVRCDLVLYHYEALVAIYKANPSNILGWDLSDKSMRSWANVTVRPDGTVSELVLTSLEKLATEIGNLKGMVDLILFGGTFDILPSEIGKLVDLESFSIVGIIDIPLEELPESIGNLKNLKYLTIKDTYLGTLPRSIGKLNELNHLVVSDSQLKTLPQEIGNLENLENLDISHNLITNLPQSIGNLKQLTYLTLDHNKLELLPWSFTALSKLTEITVSKNNLNEIAKEIGKFNLDILDLRENPLSSGLPQEICDLGSVLQLSSDQKARGICARN